MKGKRHFSHRFVVVAPLTLAMTVLVLAINAYLNAINREIDSEYDRIDRSLQRTTRLLTAIDYAFNHYLVARPDLLLSHNRKVEDGVCRMWPIDPLLNLDESRDVPIPSIDFSYMITADASLCDPSSRMYQRVASRVILAPSLSFLHDLDDEIFGIRYIDESGFVMSSPASRAAKIDRDFVSIIKTRPYWRDTAQNKDKITVSRLSSTSLLIDGQKRQVFAMTLPVVIDGDYRGMVELDVNTEVLLSKDSDLPNPIKLIDLRTSGIPDNAVHVKHFNIPGVEFHHAVYYDLDIRNEIAFFFSFKVYSLLGIVFIYVLSTVVLIYFNSDAEKTYFKDLAARDPMTGLLNRRGFQSLLQRTPHQQYIALAILDIDDFKHINDTHGHDVGDNVICYVADQILCSIRQADIAARFGGEEFVIYLTGDSEQKLQQILLRVRAALAEYASRLLERGFTVSGGVDITKAGQFEFETAFKRADDKLYQAKTNGKDKLIF